MDKTKGIIFGLIFAMVLLIAIPILMDLGHQADVSVWISKLRQEGYSAFAAPDGDVTFYGDIVPNETDTYNLGAADKRWKDLYLSGGSLHLGDSVISSTGDAVDFGSGRITNVADPTSNSDVATKAYADQVELNANNYTNSKIQEVLDYIDSETYSYFQCHTDGQNIVYSEFVWIPRFVTAGFNEEW